MGCIFKFIYPEKTSSKINCHQMAIVNLVAILWFLNGHQKCQQIHLQQPKCIITIWWQPNLIGAIEWWSNLVATWVWQSKTFQSPYVGGLFHWKNFNRQAFWWLKFFQLPHPCGDQKPFNPHNVFALPPSFIFFPFVLSSPPPPWWLKPFQPPPYVIPL